MLTRNELSTLVFTHTSVGTHGRVWLSGAGNVCGERRIRQCHSIRFRKAIAVLRDSYSGCTVAPGDSCVVPSLFARPSVAWPASFALPHLRVVAVAAGAGAGIAGWRSNLEGQPLSRYAYRHIRSPSGVETEARRMRLGDLVLL